MAAGESIETNKKWASLRQIRAAIGHFEMKQYECAMTLALVAVLSALFCTSSTLKLPLLIAAAATLFSASSTPTSSCPRP